MINDLLDTSIEINVEVPHIENTWPLNCLTSPEAQSQSLEDGDRPILCTPTKAIQEPYYVGDIRTLHLNTPKRARRSLDVARHVIEQQQKKIKTLQKSLLQKNRRRMIARNTTTGLVKHKNLLSEAAAENLKVNEDKIFG